MFRVLHAIVRATHDHISVITVMTETETKLRVHPAPSVHILAAGRIALETCAPGVCMLLQNYE